MNRSHRSTRLVAAIAVVAAGCSPSDPADEDIIGSGSDLAAEATTIATPMPSEPPTTDTAAPDLLSIQFERLQVRLGASDPAVEFRPGRSRADVLAILQSHGIGRPGQLATWFELHDGLVDQSSDELVFFSLRVASLDEVSATWQWYSEVTREIEADDDLDYQSLEFWPKPGWFPISDWTDGYFIVDTEHPDNPGRVIRVFAGDLEVWATSLAEFLRIGMDALESGASEDTWPNTV